MKKRIASLIITVLTLICSFPLYVNAERQEIPSVELVMDVPKVGDEILNYIITSKTPNVTVHNDYTPEPIDGTQWVKNLRDAGTGTSIGGKFSTGIYYRMIHLSTSFEYKLPKYTKITLNGVPAADHVGGYYVFPVKIGNGDLVDKRELSFRGPATGENIVPETVTLSTSNAIVLNAYWNTGYDPGSPASGAFEYEKDYYLHITAVASAEYYFDYDNTSITVKSVKGNRRNAIQKRVYDSNGYSYCELTVPMRTLEVPLPPFMDVDAYKWYTEGIKYCYRYGLMSGVSSSSFLPNTPLTRAMFVTILAKIDGADLKEYTGSSFNDIPTGKWYSKPVEWAFRNGYTSGTSEGYFSPDTPVTREQLAQFLYSYTKIKGYEMSEPASLDGYTDKGEISKWALNAMKWAVAEKLISGTSATTLSPKSQATRAQVATIVKGYRELILGPWQKILSLELTYEKPEPGTEPVNLILQGLPDSCYQKYDPLYPHWTRVDPSPDPINVLESGKSYVYHTVIYAKDRYLFDFENTVITVNGEAPYSYVISNQDTYLNLNPDLIRISIRVDM